MVPLYHPSVAVAIVSPDHETLCYLQNLLIVNSEGLFRNKKSFARIHVVTNLMHRFKKKYSFQTKQ